MHSIKKYLKGLKYVIAAVSLFTGAGLVLIIVISAIHFPYDVDAPLTREEVEAAQKYYTEAYRKPVSENQERSEYETKYIRVAEAAANDFRIEEQIGAFVKRFNLSDQPVLEIGSGRGYLQDAAQNYTGLDISPTVARFYHKKFVLGSATAMPFPDNSFEAIWSIWVFEHVPNPEQAFREARRVMRDNGVLFLFPAWNCTSWAADGYEVRPYSDFGVAGKLIKASIPLRSSQLFKVDSDAVNSIDSHEAILWFLSRGDECLNCDDASVFLPIGSVPFIIRVHKSAA